MLSLLLLLAITAPADTVPRGAVRGVVQSEPSGLPISAAIVEVSDSSGAFRALSDSVGFYRLTGLPPGPHRIRVHHLEHEPLEVEVVVPRDGDLSLDVSLRFRPVALDTLRAGSGGVGAGDTAVATGAEIARAESHTVDASPAAGTALPAPGDPAPGTDDDLVVRGSAADLRLVLLDGAPVYAPFHTGGLLEAFEPTVLGAARLHLAGAPARFDGGLSYVMELATRAGSPTEHTVRGSVDMVALRAVAEGPLGGGASYLAAARTVHGATLARLEDDPFPYAFRDGLVRIDVPVGSARLRAMGFGNREAVRLDPTAGDRGFAWWRSSASSVRYNTTLLEVPLEATLALSDFDAWIPQRRTEPLEGSTGRLRMALDFSRTEGPLRFRYGGSYDALRIRNQVRVPVLGGSRLVKADLHGDVVAVYGDAIIQTAPGLLLRGGARVDFFSDRAAITASPRVALTWLVGDQAALTFAGGRFHQYLRARSASVTVGPESSLADSAAYALAGELEVAEASHLSVMLDQQFAGSVRLGLEGFYKRFSGIPGTRGVATHTSGLDVWARRSQGPLTGWVGYNLAWTWAADTTDVEFEGRHVLSAGGSAAIGKRARFAMRLQFGGQLPGASGLGVSPDAPDVTGSADGGFSDQQPGTGLEVDAPVLGSAAGREYVRLDAQLSRTWEPRLAGRETEITPYLRVINALDRRDPLFYRYSTGGSNPEGVATLPLLPVFGFDWHF